MPPGLLAGRSEVARSPAGPRKQLIRAAAAADRIDVGEAKERETAAARRNQAREKVLVYLPLRGTVMTLLQANAVLRAREPYVLLTSSVRPPS